MRGSRVKKGGEALISCSQFGIAPPCIHGGQGDARLSGAELVVSAARQALLIASCLGLAACARQSPPFGFPLLGHHFDFPNDVVHVFSEIQVLQHPDHRTDATIVNPASEIFDYGTYPSAAARYAETGEAVGLVEIDASGQVTSCEITSSSRSGSIDRALCYLMERRAAFLPAVDHSHVPTVSHARVKVCWYIAPDVARHLRGVSIAFQTEGRIPPAQIPRLPPIPERPSEVCPSFRPPMN